MTISFILHGEYPIDFRKRFVYNEYNIISKYARYAKGETL